MAKVKAKSKGNIKSKRKSKVTIPEGYRTIDRAPSWDMEKYPVIDGERGPTKRIKFTDRKTGERRDAEIFTLIDDTIGAVVVWNSGGLSDLFDQSADGDTVRIEFLGLGKSKKGQNPPRLFQCSIKE